LTRERGSAGAIVIDTNVFSAESGKRSEREHAAA